MGCACLKLEHLAEEPLCCLRVMGGPEHEVERGTRRIDDAVEMIPVLLDLDVSLINALGIIRLFPGSFYRRLYDGGD